MSPVAPADLLPEAPQSSFTAYRIGRALRTAWPTLSLVEGEDSTFDFDQFAEAGHCMRTLCRDMHGQVPTSGNAPFLVESKGEDWWTPPYVPRDAPKRGDGSLA